MDNTYPSKLLPDPGGNFVVHQFIIPIRIRETVLWGWLDTGANISIIPKEIATADLGMEITDEADGGYNLASMIRVPYQTHRLDIDILEYIPGTLRNLVALPYEYSGVPSITIRDVELQVLTLTWPEILEALNPVPPIMAVRAKMPWVILGSDAVLEHLHIEMRGYDSVTISRRNP